MSNFYNKNHKIFFSLLKTAYQKKQKFFIYSAKNSKIFLILKKLQEKSLIQGYLAVWIFLKRKFFYVMIWKVYPQLVISFSFQNANIISIKTLKAFTNDYASFFFFIKYTFWYSRSRWMQKKKLWGRTHCYN